MLNSKVQREAITFRPESEVHDHDVGGRLSFKAINRQFLLKFDELGLKSVCELNKTLGSPASTGLPGRSFHDHRDKMALCRNERLTHFLETS